METTLHHFLGLDHLVRLSHRIPQKPKYTYSIIPGFLSHSLTFFAQTDNLDNSLKLDLEAQIKSETGQLCWRMLQEGFVRSSVCAFYYVPPCSVPNQTL